MTSLPLPHDARPTAPEPEPGWEGSASSWVRRGVLVLAVALASLWAATSLLPSLTTPGALFGAMASVQQQKKRAEGLDCGDCVDCVDCASEGGGCADCADCGSCADCGGCADCGALDCGGLDCACATAARPQATVGASCRRGPPWRSALLILAPLLVFAAWRRLPERRTG